MLETTTAVKARPTKASACATPDVRFVSPRASDSCRLPRLAGWRVEAGLPDAATLDAIVDRPPALLLLDVPEGDASSFAFARWLRATLGALVPVIALVSGEDVRLFERAFACGACDVLAAPVAPSLLQVKVARHARRATCLPDEVGGFKIERVLGRGGMGVVYLAARLGERVALKVLSSAGTDPESLVRFWREADALRSLRAPGIPRFVDAGHEDDVYYFAMEFVPGESLSSVLDRAPLKHGAVARIVDEVAAALEAIHAAGLVHRDVKPSNIMLHPDGTAKLVDFGLAKLAADHAVTSADDIMGTATYLAPELARGDPPSPATDAFALGMTALEASLGGSLDEGSSFEVVDRRARGIVPDAFELLCHAEPSFAVTVEGLLAVDPLERLALPEARRGFARCLAAA